MKAMLSSLAALALLGGCIHVTVRDTQDNRDDHAVNCAAPASGAVITATPVGSSPISDAPGKTITAVRLDVPPGARSNPHKHAGITFVYVLSGVVCSQVTGEAELKPYSAGQSFFEPPGSHHLGFTNPTREPASVLVTFVANSGDTLTSPL